MKNIISNIGVAVACMADDIVTFFVPPPEVKAQYQENREALNRSRTQLKDTRKRVLAARIRQEYIHKMERQQLAGRQYGECKELNEKLSHQVNLAKEHLKETHITAEAKMAEVRRRLRGQYMIIPDDQQQATA